MALLDRDPADVSESAWLGADCGRFIVQGNAPGGSAMASRGSAKHRVNVDTGAFTGGPLTAAMFDDSQRARSPSWPMTAS